jgi:hypothetical protein
MRAFVHGGCVAPLKSIKIYALYYTFIEKRYMDYRLCTNSKPPAPPDQGCSMSHQHHDHSSENPSQSISFPEKAHKLIDHWIKHNDDHAQSYHQWAKTFRLNGMASAATLLESAAELTRQINLTLAGASELVDSSDSTV